MIERGASPPATPTRIRSPELRETIASALYSESVSQRTRALVLLRQDGSQLAREKLEIVMQLDRSVLVRYEAVRLLGQLRQRGAYRKLSSTVRNLSEHPHVRAAAADALASIGDTRALQLLRDWSVVPEVEAPADVRDACAAAAERLEWLASGGDANAPAGRARRRPPVRDVAAAAATLRDGGADLYERYCALFALRDARAVSELCGALERRRGNSGDALRHEVAVVLGQIADAGAVEALAAALSDRSESDMVRHEAFQALGAIGSEACRRILADHRGTAQAAVNPL